MRCCAKCHQIKVLSEFSYKNRGKGWLVSYCKGCNRDYQKTHYKKNRLDYRIKRKQWRIKFRIQIRKKIIKYLEKHPCVDCGETDFVVLEFDHVKGDKKSEIASLISNDTSWYIIREEIKKCEVRCANCHKRRSAKQLRWYKNLE